MADLYSLSVAIRDDMTEMEIVDALRSMSKAINKLAGAVLIKRKYSLLSPCMQPLLSAAANLESASNTWNGPSPLTVPQMVVGQRSN